MISFLAIAGLFVISPIPIGGCHCYPYRNEETNVKKSADFESGI